MKMHSHRFRDPLISQARPYTILDPVIEESLRFASVRPNRNEILERFMSGQPRVAVIHGSEDHPPSIGSRELARRVIQQLWTEGALPIGVSHAIPCEELSHGLPGSHYAFLGRNVCASNIAALMEAHGYDAAFVHGACDKMFVGSLRALVEVDLARQRRKARPLYATFVPVNVGPEIHVDDRERALFERIGTKLTEEARGELFDLLSLPVSPDVYQRVKASLDRAFEKRAILEAEKDVLEGVVARRAASRGAGCASSEAAIVNRLMIAAFGLVPRSMDLSLNPPSDDALAHAVRRLVQGIHKRERRISVSQLVKSNLQNAVTVWNATGGYPTWHLHLQYLAEGLGLRLSPTMLVRKMSKVPCLLSFDPMDGRSAPGLAAESDAGQNSGVDTLMRTLSEKRLIDDRAATLDGSWMHRITDARSANGRFFHSTMTPSSPSSGLGRVHGNLCASGLACLSAGSADRDPMIYFADFYLGVHELAAALEKPRGPLERLRKKVTRDELVHVLRINASQNGRIDGEFPGVARWEKKRLWSHMIENGLLPVMFFVAGEGPKASGMPEIDLDRDLRAVPAGGVIATDGRVGFQPDSTSIVHIAPEAIDDGAIAAVRTGDWVYLNTRKGEFNVVTKARGPAGFRPLRETELSRRPEKKRRILELEKRRTAFLPSVRAVLDSVSSAALGLSPAS